MNTSSSTGSLGKAFLRPSKFRHLYGQAPGKKCCYEGLSISSDANDSALGSCGDAFLAVHWECSGGGAVGIIPIGGDAETPKTRAAVVALGRGHLGPVTASEWSPFQPALLTTGSEDCRIGLWEVSENLVITNLGWIGGHERKITGLRFHPSAEAVLASHSTDQTVRIWDLSSGGGEAKERGCFGEATEAITDFAWDRQGGTAMALVASRDRLVRLWDARGGSAAACSWQPHEGVKGIRTVWIDSNSLLTTGFGRGGSDREVALWDLRMIRGNPSDPQHNPGDPQHPHSAIQCETIGPASGLLIPFYDPDTQMLYLSGRGDASIRFYQVTTDQPPLYHLGEHRAGEAHRGLFALPKRLVATERTEVFRFFRVLGADTIEPCSMIVPRKATTTFHADLYPPTAGPEAALTASQFFEEGLSAAPLLISHRNENDVASTSAAGIRQSWGSMDELRRENERLRAQVEELKAQLSVK